MFEDLSVFEQLSEEQQLAVVGGDDITKVLPSLTFSPSLTNKLDVISSTSNSPAAYFAKDSGPSWVNSPKHFIKLDTINTLSTL